MNEIGLVGGVDEVGTGCLAGPVFAAVCVLPKGWENKGVKDSKRLTEAARERLHDYLIESALWGIGEASVEEVNTVNVLQASFLAMHRAIEAFTAKHGPLHMVLVDGRNKIPGLTIKQRPIVGGDRTFLEIGAASILAKVTRDRKMVELAKLYPHYDFLNNKGYGTPKHFEGLRLHGVCPIHRNYAAKALEARDLEASDRHLP
jgi:ribonuclease HII